MKPGESYRIGFFMVGAYQEILGDIHNLFGDTDAVEVLADADGYAITQQRRGDTTDVMLDYVGYRLDELRATYAQRVAEAQLSPERAQDRSAGSRPDRLHLPVRRTAGVRSTGTPGMARRYRPR